MIIVLLLLGNTYTFTHKIISIEIVLNLARIIRITSLFNILYSILL